MWSFKLKNHSFVELLTLLSAWNKLCVENDALDFNYIVVF